MENSFPRMVDKFIEACRSGTLYAAASMVKGANISARIMGETATYLWVHQDPSTKLVIQYLIQTIAEKHPAYFSENADDDNPTKLTPAINWWISGEWDFPS